MSQNLKIKLVHFNSLELGEYWKQFFEYESCVEIIEGDILEVKSDALVSPGNSFGFMDGGLDLLISKKYGWGIQTQLKNRIKQTELGELLVGHAIVIESKNKLIVCAPTMRIPTRKGIPESVNAYLAMKAILIEGLKNEKINSIAIPGLCTGTGFMPPYVAAKQMKIAFDEIMKGEKPEFPLYIDATKYHNNLKRNKF